MYVRRFQSLIVSRCFSTIGPSTTKVVVLLVETRQSAYLLQQQAGGGYFTLVMQRLRA